jgi:hypothetical protein
MENPFRDTRAQYGAVVSVRNVNEALPVALSMINWHGVKSSSRGVETIRVVGPVATMYSAPQERVLFDSVRDANPFFHLIESLWILAGSNTVNLPCLMLPSLAQFSDNGATFHGAYGHRLSHAFGFDQLEAAVNLLRRKPDTRQCVLSIWNPEMDLGASTKDVPCNDMIMFEISNGALNMQVINRSNDAIWGAYGANAVQFSMIQEWVAISVGVPVGYYTQHSNNLHVYPTNPFWGEFLNGNHDHGEVVDIYACGEVAPYKLATDPAGAALFRKDCMALNYEAERGAGLRDLAEVGESYYFRLVVSPMLYAYASFRDKDYIRALEMARLIEASDWRLACFDWLNRRAHAHDGSLEAMVLAAHDITKGGAL